MKDSEPDLLISRNGHVATLAMNTPRTVNALSEGMLADLTATFDQIADDQDIRAVILRGSGSHFCAGHNLKEMTARRTDTDGGLQYFQDLFAACSRMMMQIVNLPQPVIAEVRGIATAAGCQLVAACDLAVGAEDARFATSGVNVGLFCSTPMVALTRNVSSKHAMEMLLLGEFLPAARAAEIGLINRVVPEDRLAGETLAIAEALAAKSPAAIRAGKRAFYAQLGQTLEAAYDQAGRVMAENMMYQDTRRGIDAFIAKAPMPDWTGE